MPPLREVASAERRWRRSEGLPINIHQIWRDVVRGGHRVRAVLLTMGMAVLPLAALVNVDDAVPGSRVVSAGGVGSDRARELAERERLSLRPHASRSRASLLPGEDMAKPTTTTAPPPPTTAPRPRQRPKVVAKPKPKPAPAADAPAPRPAAAAAAPAPARAQEGGASFYSPRDANECAHRSLPFGTVVTVTNLATGASTTCRIGDRGPFVAGRIIDLSKHRFAALAPTSAGVIRVRIAW